VTQLEICLLGTFQITRAYTPITRFASNKVRALLAYLAVESDRPHLRDALAGLLWPESTQEMALKSLRNALANLRRAIGDREADPAYLLITRETIQFNPNSGYHLDAAELTNHDSRPQTDIRRRIAAVDGYRGPFLEGFSIPDSAAFEEWISLWRERLERKTLEGLHMLTEYYETRGEITQALAFARRRAALDPWMEEGHYQVMRLLAISGQREQAIRQYQNLFEILSKNLDVAPNQNTVRLYQEILSGKFPAAQPNTHTPHNLPVQQTSFIGREAEIEKIKHAILSGQTRLVTVTGSGGTGKTRLALRVGEELLDAFPHGVWLIELAALSEPELVPPAVASILKQRESPDQSILEILFGYLRSKKVLIIFDTCEHLVSGVASLVDQILNNTTQVILLVTSREILGVSREFPLLCPNLALPEPSLLKNMTIMEQHSAIRSCEAVRLFADRSAVASSGFTLTEKDSPVIAEVCRRLDGIPLAIELAAARMGMLSIEQISERLDHAFEFLADGSRTALPRQQTLKAAIDWSFNLLTPTERALLTRLAIFSGGWTLEAAEAVCWGECSDTVTLSLEEIFNLSGRLADKSLVLAETGNDGKLRYRMLDTIHQYALDRLLETKGDSNLRERHLVYFIQFAEEAEPHLRGWGMAEWLNRIELEMGNLRLAMEWALAYSIEQGLRLAVALKWFWHIHNHRYEGIQWLERLLEADSIGQPLQEQPPASRLVRGVALIVAGTLNHYYPGVYFEQAQIQWKEGKKIIQELGDQGQNYMPFVTFFTPSTEEEVRINLALARQLGDELYTAELLWVYRNFLLVRGDANQAEACARENLAIRQKIGDVDGEALALYIMADSEFMKGNSRRAI
jgi:predicted ATPase/DNA-binding SARP family transcriptional activator